MSENQHSEPFVLRWGILATGSIAATFTRDLILDPSSVRSVTDVRHVLAAVASSSSSSRAASFVRDDCKHPSPSQVHTYDSYADLAADPTVDIIYIATPHSHHFQNAMLCLKAGKHVLCEKPVTVNAAQARQLFETARTRNLFFLEGVWTRFFPLTCELRRLVREEKTIGVVKRVFADLAFSPEGLKLSSETGDSGDDLERKHRLVNLDLAGGTLLDCGIYTLTWIFQFLYHIEPLEKRHRPTVVSSMTKYPPTGCDETTSMILTFPAAGAQGVATTSMRVGQYLLGPDLPSIRIQGTLGEIQVHGPPYRPIGYRIVPTAKNIAAPVGAGDKISATIGTDNEANPTTPVKAPDNNNSSNSKDTSPTGLISYQIPGTGMFYEADECARCIRDGRYESEVLAWDESLALMEVMDEVRQQHGLVFPDSVERC